MRGGEGDGDGGSLREIQRELLTDVLWAERIRIGLVLFFWSGVLG